MTRRGYPQTVRHVLSSGEIKTYHYDKHQRTPSAADLAREALKKGPLVRVKLRGGYMWNGGKGGASFRDRTIAELIEGGFVDFVAIQGKVR